jgi:hypothetical protein
MPSKDESQRLHCSFFVENILKFKLKVTKCAIFYGGQEFNWMTLT